MTNEMKLRAIRLLLRQARYDQPARYEVKFPDCWVLGNKLFLTEDAVKGFPNPLRRLIERVQIEEAVAYAKENPWIVDAIREEKYQ